MLFHNHTSLNLVVVLHKYKNLILSCTTPFLLLYYFAAACFGHSGSFSGHASPMSKAKFYIKLQLKLHEIALHKIHQVLQLISGILCT